MSYRMSLLANILLALLLVHFSLSGPLSRQIIANREEDSSKYRLSENVKPIAYTIKLTPNLTDDTFEGQIAIKIQIKENTKQIILHSKDLEILKDNIEVEEAPEEGTIQNVKVFIPVESAAIFGTPEQEFFKIVLKSELKVCNKYIIKVSKFKGNLNSNNKGFYIAKYKDENGIERKLATTQFEPTKARLAFPCFDEPALKAKFKITLVKPNKNYVAVSNTPLKQTRNVKNSNQVEDEFEETVEMSTYLIAFIVSEMQLSDTVTVANIKHRILARPQAIKNKNEQYALNIGSNILKEIGKFVNIPYSLTKMDQAAIPDSYFSAGAMENWGLVTYKEMYLLYSNVNTTTSTKQFITTIISHEFGHQWFGNLVSPQWWKYLWLNEGFANYFEYRGADLVQKDWGIMDQYVVKNVQYAFGPDGLENSTRPMNYDAGSPAAISALFDRIAYEKSGSVIRMMEMFLTTEVFKKGLNYYLDNRKYKDGHPDYLYKYLQKALDENPKINLPKGVTASSIMETWTTKEGYPVVYVKRNHGGENTILLSQSRFLLKSATAPFDSSWAIPINFATKTKNNFANTSADVWLTVKEANVDIDYLKKDDWLIVNKQQTGYYRVNYDVSNWNMLVKALIEDHNQIHLLNRAQLIDDSFNLARSGRLSYDIPLELSLYLKNETNYIPFYSFFTAISFINTMFSESPFHDTFKERVLDTLSGVYGQLGYEEKKNDTHMDKLNRISVLKWLCDLGHSECRTTALTKLKNWKNNTGSPIPVDLQAPTFCGAIRTAGESEWDFLYEKYVEVMDGTDTDLIVRIRNSLGCSENVDILNKFIGASVEGRNKITAENAFTVICNSGSVGVKASFEYLLKNFKSVHSKLGDRVTSIFNVVGNKLTTDDQVEKLQQLSQKNKEHSHLFQAAINKAKENANWNNNRIREITNWLDIPNKSAMSHATYSGIFIVVVGHFILNFLVN